MKRDYDLIRKILFALEEKDKGEGVPLTKLHLGFGDVPDEEYFYHTRLMEEAGLINAMKLRGYGRGMNYFPSRLTNEGHDFLANIRNEKVWNQVKKDVGGTVETVSLEVLKFIAVETVKTFFRGGFTG